MHIYRYRTYIKGRTKEMEIIKYIAMGFILLASSYTGILMAGKYTNRVKELKQMKTALNLFETKVKFTYEPIPKIFQDIAAVSYTHLTLPTIA